MITVLKHREPLVRACAGSPKSLAFTLRHVSQVFIVFHTAAAGGALMVRLAKEEIAMQVEWRCMKAWVVTEGHGLMSSLEAATRPGRHEAALRQM